MSEGKATEVDVAAQLITSDAAPFLMVAHELKSPLAVIRQLALSLEETYDSQMATRYIHQIRLTSERALRLTSDVTRSVRQDTLFDLEPLNPLSICEEVAHELTPLFIAQGKCIEVIGHTRPPLLVGNRDLLRRVLLNFGDNALHYARSDHPVRLQVQGIGDQVRVGVRDYGPLVAADVWQTLIIRLQARAIQPLSGRPQSSGLGLYTASQFAHMMNGHIGATRHRNGATFYIDMAASRQLSLL
ncbi:MAG: HAMP domain-containing sensor histidine kinase [Candidatus Saccharimonadales bacterium]